MSCRCDASYLIANAQDEYLDTGGVSIDSGFRPPGHAGGVGAGT